MTITIYGASDDCVEVEGCEGADEFYVSGQGEWRGDLVAPGGTDQMRLYAAYSALTADAGTWLIGTAQTSEDVPFPKWPISIRQHDSGYSTIVTIDAPPGTRLTNVHGSD